MNSPLFLSLIFDSFIFINNYYFTLRLIAEFIINCLALICLLILFVILDFKLISKLAIIY